MKTEQAPPLLIAIVDDEPPIRRFLRTSLVSEGYRIVEGETARDALRIATQERVDLMILDLGLPDRDGIEVIAELRGWTSLPIIVLSARDRESEKVAALDRGADDYLTKPFGVGELLARLRVALRHRQGAKSEDLDLANSIYEHGGVKVDLIARRVFRDDREIRLTKIEFDLLAVLIRNAGKVLTHRYLLKEVWGPHNVLENHYVRVFVANLRKKLELESARPKIILTEPGVGYRLMESEK
ncbi:MAG TPA: response regulator [Pirellulaceae bacterium]|nr:response regulator [Pirellulaceae bacterium]